MRRCVLWLKALPGKPVFVGYPAGFDFLFVYWYLIRFAGESPFSFSALDIKTYAMALLKKDYRKSTKGGMPKHWFDSHDLRRPRPFNARPLYNDSSSRKSSRVTPRTALPSNRSELTTSSFSREKVLINQSNSNGEA
jgi:hypothetical protein